MTSTTKNLKSNPDDQITLLIFKGNLAARTFRLPLSWISSAGLLLGALILIVITAIFLTTKFYRSALRSDPTQVIELEKQLATLQTSYDQLKKQTLEASPALETETPVETPPVSVPTKPSSSILFRDLPPQYRIRDRGTLPPPIRLSALEALWTGSRLKIHFNILYVGKDGGNQQGRILVLARGPESLIAYPKGVMDLSDPTTLLNPQKGEYFSVSRFRRGEADFGTISRSQSLRDAEILLFDQEGYIILKEKIRIPERTRSVRVQPQTREEPEISSSPPPTPTLSNDSDSSGPAQGTPNGRN